MVSASSGLTQPRDTPDNLPAEPFAAQIDGRYVTFLARDLQSGAAIALFPDRIDERHAPWSTFKIPNLVIALETGVASGPDHKRRWDRLKRPPEDYWPDVWKKDHTLESAFRASAVWYFRDIALEVGANRYRTVLRNWRYGNAEVPDRSDSFWLAGPLEISVREQVAFLADLLGGHLGVSAVSLSALRKASELRREGSVALYAKTGAGRLPGGSSGGYEGWLTGFVEHDGRPRAVFALYVRGPDFRSIRTFRRSFAEALLKAAGMLPGDW